MYIHTYTYFKLPTVYNFPFNHNLKVYFHVNDANFEVPKYHK